MPKKLHFDSKTLLNQTIPAIDYGYDPNTVDELLDKIIEDYRSVENGSLEDISVVETLKKEIKMLREKNESLMLEVQHYEGMLGNISDQKDVTVDNLALKNRINVLEKCLFKAGINPATIK